MEPAGFAVSVFALATLFNNVVECFEYVQLGRKFDGDFQTSLLKLDDARLRLSRWGESVGLSDDLQDADALRNSRLSPELVIMAKGRLEQIQQLFVEAEDTSKKLTGPNKNSSVDLSVRDPTDLDSTAAGLHIHMRELAIRRQNRTASRGIRQRAKWALYEEKHFRKLIGDVTELVSGLTELFPAAKQSQQQLCEAEVRGISTESLAMLKDAIAGQDIYLETVIAKTMGERRESPSSVSISGSNYSGLQLGENKGSMSGFNFHAGKGA